MADKKSRTRQAKLKKAGIAVLEEYVRLHPDDARPTTITQKSLLEQIRGVQDNRDIKLRSISGWFKRRHVRGQQYTVQPDQQQQQVAAPLTPLTPTSPPTPFTEESLRSLHTLVQATPDPGPEVLDIWASLFHVSLPVLRYAIQVVLPLHFPSASQTTFTTYQAQSNHTNINQSSRHNSHSQRLPTPSDSLTPEPVPTDQWLHHRESPRYPKNELHLPMLESSRSEPSTSHHQHDRPNEGGTHPSKSSVPGSSTVSAVDPEVLLQVCKSNPSPPLTPVVPTTKPKPKIATRSPGIANNHNATRTESSPSCVALDKRHCIGGYRGLP